MNSFDKLFSDIYYEQQGQGDSVGIFPGAFKPPHIGHYTTALNACKTNDIVYIFVSSKARALTTQNINTGKEMPDSARYKNLFQSDKFTGNLNGISTAGVARMTSASAFRAAITVKDKNTIAKNLPKGVDVDSIFNILMSSNDIDSPNYGHVTIDQTMAIWNVYKPLLSQQSGLPENDINIMISETSPVRDTYELVDEINKSNSAARTHVNVYVGE